MVSRAIEQAQQRVDLTVRVHGIYEDVTRAIDARRPRCDVSGRCCRFEEYGHLLFVTTIELAAFAMGRNDAPEIGAGCPYQIDGLCSVHTIRPFGCRIYFCDPTAQEWQQMQYEQFHLRLRQLHDELDVPYFYVEWRQGLRAIAGISNRVPK